MSFVIGPMSWLFGSSEPSGPPPPPPAPGIPIPRRVPTILWIAETPIERLGLQLVRAAGGLHDAALAPLTVTSYPGLTGGRFETLQTVAPRVIELEGHHIGSDFGARARWLDTLKTALRGRLPIRWADTPDRVAYGVATLTTADSASPLAWVDPTLRIRVLITCADTASYDRHAAILPLSTTPRAVPLGTLPSGGELGVLGAYDGALSVDLLSPTGVTLERLALVDLALAAGEALTVRLDPPHALVLTRADGTQVAVAQWRSVTASSRWWQPSPVARDQAPRLVLVPADPADTPVGWYRYHRAWS